LTESPQGAALAVARGARLAFCPRVGPVGAAAGSALAVIRGGAKPYRSRAW